MGTLMDTSDEVKSILDTNDQTDFKNNTTAFAGLLKQVKAANADLATLKANIASIAGKISDAAGIIAAIEKVGTLLV